MTSKELRIGNLVGFMEDGTVMEVTSIEDSGIGVKYLKNEDWIELTQFEYIPLTEDWLKKFGFIKANDSYGGWLSPSIYRKRMRIRRTQGRNFYYSTNNTANPLFTPAVHELQNLYYALMQVDLEYQSDLKYEKV